ncbi:MAG: TonB-dependent receptor [Bacteroidota bacterium]|nr:TonB-dependent receptor [Bacteroidota bacterium]
MKIYFYVIVLLFSSLNSYGGIIQGIIKDSKSNEILIGATVNIKELKLAMMTGLDGSFRFKQIPRGNYTLQISYVGYTTIEEEINTRESEKAGHALEVLLDPVQTRLKEVVVSAHGDKSTDVSARTTERESPNLMNVVSAKTIELSPDVDVASVVQRMSGVTLDKSSSGSGEYAILRGMDKRYSYTLINGIKMPSTNDQQRYTSLDIFPSDLVDRVEVSKVLTPDMEGDAIAGAVNMSMKNAPDHFLLKANAAIGYNAIWEENKFMTFNYPIINSQSPYELNGKTYQALSPDFTKSNLDPSTLAVPLNRSAGLTIGNRFLGKRLGWILAASYNNTYKGTQSLIFGEDQSTDGKNLPILSSMKQRFDYNHQQNYGIHNKFDVTISPHHSIHLYLAYMNFELIQIRDEESTELGNNSYDPEHGSKNVTQSERNRLNVQTLFNATLQGNHSLGPKFSIQWSAVYSVATNRTPDMSTVSYDRTYVNYTLQPQYVDFGGSDRLWLHNSDADKAGYLNFKYRTPALWGKFEFSAGGLYRDKTRSSFYNDYTLIPRGPVDEHSAKGVDWNRYSDINWSVQDPLGAVNTPGTFTAYEKERAGYGMFQYTIAKIRVIGGARYENSYQGYDEVFHSAFLDKYKPGNNQKRDHRNDYLLPSINFEYNINNQNNLKASYYTAINKPGFLEIVPYLDNTGDYPKTGNPDLKNAVAYNYDVRYEFFPNQLDQALAGIFYKKMNNAIEEGFMTDGHGNYNLSFSNSNAVNYGFEADVIKYFSEFGFKANYTWTHSRTSSFKRSQVNGVLNNDSTVSSLQYRPLCGQAEHVGNISLLYKGASNGYNAQLALSYTGDRIYKVSPDINGDLWQKGFLQMDLSAEKKFKSGIGIYIKARNLLNTHVNVYLKEANSTNSQFPCHSVSDKTTALRDEYSDPSYLIGLRYNFR